MADLLEDDRNGAKLSDDRQYRWSLWRTWDADLPTAVFVLLNPATADETTDDTTLTKCINYAKRWGYGRIELVNLFGYRTKHPDDLHDVDDPVGQENDLHLYHHCDPEKLVVVGWGNHGEIQGRGREVATTLEEFGVELFALGTTQDGHPWHPARKPGDLDPEPFGYGGEE